MKRRAKDTLTAIEMDRGEVEEFELLSGDVVHIELLSTSARVLRTSLKQLKIEEDAARTDYAFACVLNINGTQHTLEREVSTPKSFYDPWEINGVHIWLDAVDDVFNLLVETHGECRPRKHARFALQDATLRICPEPLHPWCPWPDGGLRIENCYRGEDCWLGAYDGASAHGGLDINHPPGTPLWAPLDIHDHFYFNSLKMGHNNNRWRGIHRWQNGAEWILQAHHMTELTVREHEPIKKGQQFARGAGVLSGAADHSHFVFKVHDYGETVFLDPWILFWQMYQDWRGKQNPEWVASTRDAFQTYQLYVKQAGHSPFLASGWKISRLMPTQSIVNAPHVGLAADAGWQPVPAAPSGGEFVDVHERSGPEGFVYLARTVRASEAGEWILHVGHDGGARVFVDSEPVAAAAGVMNPAPFRRTQARVDLAAGEHEIVVALDRAGGKGWGIFVCFECPGDRQRPGHEPSWPC